jgi:hypothetical protein
MGKNKQVSRIAVARLTIYDELPVDSDLRIASEELEQLLRKGLKGIDVAHLPLRSRSKFVKSRVCEIMGYPVPLSFTRFRPRFPGQDLDLYVQKSRNLQVWNESIQPNRRYAIAILSPKGVIVNVHVLRGIDLQKLDKTGKLTSKNQAILRTAEEGRLSKQDTKVLDSQLTKRVGKILSGSPTDQPNSKSLLSIGELHRRLKSIEGKDFEYGSATDERLRGVSYTKQCVMLLVTRTIGTREHSQTFQPNFLKSNFKPSRRLILESCFQILHSLLKDSNFLGIAFRQEIFVMQSLMQIVLVVTQHFE